MKSLLLILLLSLISGIAWAESSIIDPYKLADCIYKAEGGARAKVPYGILSVKVHSEAEARKVCIRTIENNMARWQWATQHGDKRDFITFLGDRYCPAVSDPKGHKAWISNVHRLYEA